MEAISIEKFKLWLFHITNVLILVQISRITFARIVREIYIAFIQISKIILFFSA
jgi:hypothetical protein